MICRGVLVAALLFFFIVSATAAEPSTVAGAAEKLDLVTLPIPAGAEMMGYRREAQLSYHLKQPAKYAFDFVDAQLAERGWEQMPSGQNSGDFANGDYRHGDYVVHVSVSPRSEGTVGVSISQKGNVPLESLPVPKGTEKLYAFIGIITYKSPDTVVETAHACQELMVAGGWSPYGEAGDTKYFRKNAVLAHVNVASAPGQGGATTISLSTELLSLELPAPPFADGFRYSDGTTAILYDCDKTEEESADFYRQALAPLGWTSTTDEPIQVKWEKHTIFRNPSQEMITVRTHEFEGRTRTHMNHQNVAEVGEEELRGLIAAGEKAKYDRKLKWLPVQITLPGDATVETLEDWAFRVSATQGEAFGLADQIIGTLRKAGWAADGEPSDAPYLRSTRLAGHDRALHVVALDPPQREAWVAVVGVGGVKLEAVK